MIHVTSMSYCLPFESGCSDADCGSQLRQVPARRLVVRAAAPSMLHNESSICNHTPKGLAMQPCLAFPMHLLTLTAMLLHVLLRRILGRRPILRRLVMAAILG